MVINETLIQYEVYDNGTRLLGIATVELPELKFKTTEVSGAGVAGTLDTPIQGSTESLELKISWRTLYKTAVKMLKHGAISLSLRAALQAYDARTGAMVFARKDVRDRAGQPSVL